MPVLNICESGYTFLLILFLILIRSRPELNILVDQCERTDDLDPLELTDIDDEKERRVLLVNITLSSTTKNPSMSCRKRAV
jgi:hypothetical protein